jgi:hypothetical protein
VPDAPATPETSDAQTRGRDQVRPPDRDQPKLGSFERAHTVFDAAQAHSAKSLMDRVDAALPDHAARQVDGWLRPFAENKPPLEIIKALSHERTSSPAVEHLLSAAQKLVASGDLAGASDELKKAEFAALKGFAPRPYHDSLDHLKNFATQPLDKHNESLTHLKNGEFVKAFQAAPELRAALAAHPLLRVFAENAGDTNAAATAFREGRFSDAAGAEGKVVNRTVAFATGLDAIKFAETIKKAGDAFANGRDAEAGQLLDDLRWQLVDVALVLLLHEISKGPTPVEAGEGVRAPAKLTGEGLERPKPPEAAPKLSGEGISRQPDARPRPADATPAEPKPPDVRESKPPAKAETRPDGHPRDDPLVVARVEGAKKGQYWPEGTRQFKDRAGTPTSPPDQKHVVLPKSEAERLGFRAAGTPPDFRIEPRKINGELRESLGAGRRTDHPITARTSRAPADATATPERHLEMKTPDRAAQHAFPRTIGADARQAAGYNACIDANEYGILRPGNVSTGGVDAITAAVAGDRAKIYLNDFTSPGASKSSKPAHLDWAHELRDAVGTDPATGKPRLDLQNPRVEQAIRKAIQTGEIYVRTVRVDIPPDAPTPVVRFGQPTKLRP